MNTASPPSTQQRARGNRSSTELTLVAIVEALQPPTSSAGRGRHPRRACSLSPMRSVRSECQVGGHQPDHSHLSLEREVALGGQLAKSAPQTKTPLTKEIMAHALGTSRSRALLRTVSLDLSIQSAAQPRPRIQILYRDEALRTRFCENAQQLIALVQSDPSTTATSTSTFIARKALRYRRVNLESVSRVDTRDPTFDVSRFFGVQWRKASPDE